jgi:hypothetical protein
MKIRPVGAEFFHADRRKERRTDGRTDVTKLILAFRNFVNAPKNSGADLVNGLHVSACQLSECEYIYIYITKMSASFFVVLFLCFIADFFNYFGLVSVSLCSSTWLPFYFCLYFTITSLFLTPVFYLFVYRPCLLFSSLYFSFSSYSFLSRIICHS